MTNSKHVDATFLFFSPLSLIDLKTALDKTYPEELLSLKLKEVQQNKYEFRDYSHEFIDCRSFISFEFMKMVCCSKIIVDKFEDKEFFRFSPIGLSLKNETKTVQPDNLEELFSNLVKPNDFFDDFLEDWKVSFTTISKNKTQTFQKQIDSNKISSIFENCYDITYGIRIMHNSMKKNQLLQVLSTFYSKGFQINQIRKNIFDVTDTMPYCSGFDKLDLILLIKVAQQNLLGFKLLNFYYRLSNTGRTKWVKSEEIPIITNEVEQDVFERIIKEKQIVKIEKCNSYSIRFTSEITYDMLVTIFQSLFPSKIIEIKKIGRNNYELVDFSKDNVFDYACFVMMCKNKVNACDLLTVCMKEDEQKRWKWVDAENVSIQYEQNEYESFIENFKFQLLLPQKANRQIELSSSMLRVKDIKNIVKEFESRNLCKPNLIFPSLSEILDTDDENDNFDLTKLDGVIQMHCQDGFWNWDLFTLGLANGLILAKSILTNQNLKFLQTPKKFLSKKKYKHLIKEGSE